MLKSINPGRIFILVTLLTVLAGPSLILAQAAPDYPIRFVVIGDRTGEHQEGIYEQAIAEMSRMKPDFAVTVGDMIEGYSQDTAVINNEWREYFKLIEPLGVPIHFTPGNHDITFDEMEPSFEKFVGKPYYSFDEHGLHFIVLDNSRWESIGTLPKEQIDWIAKDLEEHAGAAYTFVFLHKPFWYRTIADNKPDTLHSLFVRYGVDGVFTGHFHSYFTGTFNGIPYTGVGSSGADCETSPTGLKYHFVWVTVAEDGVHITPVKLGSALRWDDMSVDEEKLISTIAADGLTFTTPVGVSADLTVKSTRLTVKIDNSRSSVATEDTLRWEVPASWSIQPQTAAFAVGPRESGFCDFTVSCSGSLYPLPSVSSFIGYAPDRMVPLNKAMPIVREVVCWAAKQPPTIDGILSEGVWSAPAPALLGPDGGKSPIDSTALYFAYDDSNLYFAALCREQNADSMMATLTERDAAVFGEDCVGIMLQSVKGDSIGYQIYINPLGTIYDQRLFETTDGYWDADNTWNGTYEVKTAKGDGYWAFEARIPMSQLGLRARSGESRPLNFRRKQRRVANFAGFQIPWTYDPANWGVLVFE